jgi:hypothetical protein
MDSINQESHAKNSSGKSNSRIVGQPHLQQLTPGWALPFILTVPIAIPKQK